MGFGKKFKAIAAPVVQAIPGGEKVVESGALGVFGLPLESSLDKASRDKANLDALAAQASQTASAQAAQAEAERQKALAEETVRKQEELARRRTIFGGDANAQTQERKRLLGE